MPHPKVEAAAAVLAESPDPAGFPATNRGWPAASWVGLLRRAGWPTATVVIDLPKSGGVGMGHPAPQPATVVPLTWLRDLARRYGVPLRDVCRGRIRDE